MLSHDIVRSGLYEQRRNSMSPATAIREAAHELSGRVRDKLSGTSELLETISLLGGFVQAAVRLDRFDELKKAGLLTPEQKQESIVLKQEFVIPFNHSVKGLIDTNPLLSYTGLVRGLTDVYTKLYSHHDALLLDDTDTTEEVDVNNALSAIQRRVNGMRHEMAAETLLTAAGIDYDYKTSIEDDVNGKDLFVFIDGKWEHIDIKASIASEQRAHELHPSSRAVWTGLSPRDFTGIQGDSPNSLSISYDVAIGKGDEFVKRIRDVLQRPVRTIGKSALGG